MLRRLKIIYILYNFFHKKKLLHNLRLYKTTGLKRFYFSPISSKNFRNIDKNLLKKSESIRNTSDTQLFQKLDAQSQKSILNFENEGYAVLKDYLDESTVDGINEEIDNLLEEKKISFTNGNKIMFAIHKSEILKK